MKRAMLILIVIAVIAVVFYMRYVSEVKNYKNTEEIICQLVKNKMCEIEKAQICDSWGNELKYHSVSNGAANIISSGSDGKYGTDDDILGFIEKNDSGWLLLVKWNYGLDSAYSHHAFFSTDKD